MQKKMVRYKDVDGIERTRTLEVMRTWQSEKFALYLLKNGNYTNRDGSPVVSADAFEVIDSEVQRAVALAWWVNRGKAWSEEYYAARDARLSALARDPELHSTPESELDSVEYFVRVENGPWSEDSAVWGAYFAQRPDWWGVARTIDFGNRTFRRSDVEADEPKRGRGKKAHSLADAAKSAESDAASDAAPDAAPGGDDAAAPGGDDAAAEGF